MSKKGFTPVPPPEPGQPQLQAQVTNIDVTLPAPPIHESGLPGYFQPLLDAVINTVAHCHVAGYAVAKVESIKFTNSPIDPASGRGDLTLRVTRVKIPEGKLNEGPVHGSN